MDNNSGTVTNEFGAQRSQTATTIKLRGNPDVVTSDRLVYNGQTFVIDGMRWTDWITNETICDVHTLELD